MHIYLNRDCSEANYGCHKQPNLFARDIGKNIHRVPGMKYNESYITAVNDFIEARMINRSSQAPALSRCPFLGGSL